MILQAPYTFLIALAIVFVGIWAVIHIIYRERLNTKDSIIESLRIRLEERQDGVEVDRPSQDAVDRLSSYRINGVQDILNRRVRNDAELSELQRYEAEWRKRVSNHLRGSGFRQSDIGSFETLALLGLLLSLMNTMAYIIRSFESLRCGMRD